MNLGLFFLLATGFALNPGISTSPAWTHSSSLPEETITLVIQFDEKKSKKIEEIPYKKEMTILDVMNYAKQKKKLEFKYRGKNDLAFLTQIEDIKNKGARGPNWIFRVNGKLGKKSFGVSTLKPGDKVTWTFGKYKP